VVLDPVMVATSGAVLIDQPAIQVLIQELFPRATLVTPNLDEAALLVGQTPASLEEMEQAAHRMLDMGAKAVLLKGGHLAGDMVSDLLLRRGSDAQWMHAPRIPTANTHGTGCTLSSAIAAYLALGASMVDAVQAARTFVRQALEYGAAVRTGHGSGPLNHGFAPQVMQRRQIV